MSIYDRLHNDVQLHPEQTSYFTEPAQQLDPTLFSSDMRLHENIRRGVLASLYNFWQTRYANSQSWSRAYLAGSGVSYLWQAARDPGDLDCLIGISYPDFRQANQDMSGLGDSEIQKLLNDELRTELWPLTDRWYGYELTFYALRTLDIVSMHPYAAYDVTGDQWVVRPDRYPQLPEVPEWKQAVRNDTAEAKRILARYDRALDEMDAVSNPGLRLNAQITLRAAARQAAQIYHEIHSGRDLAFAPDGRGFDDFNEYRYKSAKGSGALKALGQISQDLDDAGLAEDEEMYGGLPDARQSLITAAIGNRYK